MLSVVVLNYNDYETTYNYVMNIKEYKIIDKIIIVDNASSDDSYNKLIKLKSSKIDILNTGCNGGYGSGNNYGIKYAYEKYQSEYVIISNPDVEVSELTIEHCLNALKSDNQIAIVAPMMKNTDLSINYNCVWRVPTRKQYLLFSTFVLRKFSPSFYYTADELATNKVRKVVGCVAGSFFMAKTELIIRYGMFDENIFLYCEETLLGLKMKKANLKSVVLLDDFFIHHHAVSINKSIKSLSRQRKITWKSRCYVIEKYYRTNLFNKIVDYSVSRICMLEYHIYDNLKRK